MTPIPGSTWTAVASPTEMVAGGTGSRVLRRSPTETWTVKVWTARGSASSGGAAGESWGAPRAAALVAGSGSQAVPLKLVRVASCQ